MLLLIYVGLLVNNNIKLNLLFFLFLKIDTHSPHNYIWALKQLLDSERIKMDGLF